MSTSRTTSPAAGGAAAPLLSLLLCASSSLLAYSLPPQSADWLVVDVSTPTTVTQGSIGAVPTLTLSNGLISRSFALPPGAPCFTTIELALPSSSGRTFFRALSPESTLSVNGTPFNLGSCLGQPSGHSEFFDPSLYPLTADPLGWTYAGYTTSAPVAAFPWTPGTRHAPTNITWPPSGLHLAVSFTPPAFVPQANATNVSGTFPGMEYPCPPSGCLTGWYGCDNTTVGGQCTFPRATAASLCSQWSECTGVNCNDGRSDCQARAAPIVFQTNSGFTSIVRAAPWPSSSNATITVNYEVYDGIPLIRKWISASANSSGGTASGSPFVVDDLTIELLRSPNFAPEDIHVVQVAANNPAPFQQQVVPQLDQSFPGRTQQLWNFDPDYDSCCDSELHVSWTYYTALAVGYGFDVTFGSNTGPGALVTPGNDFTSVDVRLLFHDSSETPRQGLGLRKMQARLAPQLMESPLYYMITDISSQDVFRTAIDQAAAAGFELVVVGFGAAGYCGLCDAELTNQTWRDWMKSQVDYGRSKGVGISCYTLMQHNGWGETVPAAEQVLNRDGSRGGIACFATDWHAAYRAAVLNFTAEVGLEGIETDGQYENAACADEGGDHHHNGVDGSWHAQLAATTSFNIGLKEVGAYQTGADAYFWSGANHWNHADTDAGFGIGDFFESIAVGREYVSDSVTWRLHTSGSYPIGDISNRANTGECVNWSPLPSGFTSGRLACIDWALASFFGSGVTPMVVGSSIWPPGDPDEAALTTLFAGWTSFYSTHRTVLVSPASLPLLRTTLRWYEANAHWVPVSTNPPTPAGFETSFVSAYNPSSRTINDTLAVPLYYSNLAPGAKVNIYLVSPTSSPVLLKTAVVGSDGGAIYDVTLPISLGPKTYSLYSIQTA